jgi:dynactin complex subunit
MWSGSSFRAEVMQQEKTKLQVRNDALQEVLKQLEAELKDSRQKLADAQTQLAARENEVSSLKLHLKENSTQPQASQALSDALVSLLEVLPSQASCVEDRVKAVLNLLPNPKQAVIWSKRTKKPSSLRRLFSFIKSKSG